MKLSRIVPVAIVLCAFTLASCANTVRGVGRDVKALRTLYRKQLNKLKWSRRVTWTIFERFQF